MKNVWSFCLLLTFTAAKAQPGTYSVANTHSHNDYEQQHPFWMAYDEGFGSIEADIFLRNGKLLVGHDTIEIKAGRTLEEYYIRPLVGCIHKNHGHPYADPSRQLQILIDVKEDSVATLGKLVEVLKKYPPLTRCSSLKWVISGSRPDPARYADYPSFIWFDGILHQDYSPAALEKIAMMSDNLSHYSRWNGLDTIPADQWKTLQAAIDHSHSLHKPVRLWGAPDFVNAWHQFILLKVDYINTDHIHELAGFLQKAPPPGVQTGSRL